MRKKRVEVSSFMRLRKREAVKFRAPRGANFPVEGPLAHTHSHPPLPPAYITMATQTIKTSAEIGDAAVRACPQPAIYISERLMAGDRFVTHPAISPSLPCLKRPAYD